MRENDKKMRKIDKQSPRRFGYFVTALEKQDPFGDFRQLRNQACNCHSEGSARKPYRKRLVLLLAARVIQCVWDVFIESTP